MSSRRGARMSANLFRIYVFLFSFLPAFLAFQLSFTLPIAIVLLPLRTERETDIGIVATLPSLKRRNDFIIYALFPLFFSPPRLFQLAILSPWKQFELSMSTATVLLITQEKYRRRRRRRRISPKLCSDSRLTFSHKLQL